MPRSEPVETILGFDTSGPALLAGLVHARGETRAEGFEAMARGQAERLLPFLEEQLASAALGWASLQAIGVGIGPGNFTGIRIAVSAARGLALALGIPAIGVSEFDLLAEHLPKTGALLAIPAPRGQAYLQPLQGDGQPLRAPLLFAPDAPELDRELAALGLPLLTAQTEAPETQALTELAARLKLGMLPPVACRSGSAIARIAARKLASGATLERPAPLYLRPADAAPSSNPPPVILP